MPKAADPPRRRRESPDVRRDQILDAAERVLLERGLAATTVADVAEAAGIAKGTVYLYYQSKNDLLAGLRARHVEGFSDRLTRILDQPGRRKPLARIELFVDGFFEHSFEHRRLHHLLFHEAGFSEDDAFVGVRQVLRDFVAEGIANGDFAKGDAELVTDFLLSGIHGSLVSALHEPDQYDRSVTGARDMTRRLLATRP
jgi:TetR/AcrR family transcriptional repressor of nem operon